MNVVPYNKCVVKVAKQELQFKPTVVHFNAEVLVSKLNPVTRRLQIRKMRNCRGEISDFNLIFCN
jgi:hypothetical protein